MKELRTRLKKQGMDLSMKQFEFPSYMTHKAYKGLLAAASMYLTSGSYSNNEWDLDGTSNPQRFVNMMRRVKAVHPEHFPNDPMEAIRGLDQPRNQPLTLDEAAYIICHSAGRTAPENKALDDLQELGWISEETLKSIDKPESLSNGEVFMLIRDLTDYYLNIRYK